MSHPLEIEKDSPNYVPLGLEAVEQFQVEGLFHMALLAFYHDPGNRQGTSLECHTCHQGHATTTGNAAIYGKGQCLVRQTAKHNLNKRQEIASKINTMVA